MFKPTLYGAGCSDGSAQSDMLSPTVAARGAILWQIKLNIVKTNVPHSVTLHATARLAGVPPPGSCFRVDILSHSATGDTHMDHPGADLHGIPVAMPLPFSCCSLQCDCLNGGCEAKDRSRQIQG